MLASKKAALKKQWFEALVETYPANTANFLKNKKDAFANPVGQTARNALEGLLDVLLGNMDPKTAVTHLDPIIRIRAIQTMFSPSQAVGFIFSLKKITRQQLTAELEDSRTLNELNEFDVRIDTIALLAFDIFVKCREKIYDIKANEEKNKIYKAFARAGLVAEIPENGSDINAS